MRTHPLRPSRHKPVAGAIEDLGRARRHGMQDVATLEISCGRDIEGAGEGARRVDAEHGVELRRRPEIETALLALAIGVEAGVERALRRRHLAQHEGQRFLGDTSKRRVMGQLPGVEIRPRQQGVVVEHLLEVRYQPPLVDAVAVEASAKLVVDAAGRHRAQRLQGHLQRGRLPGAHVVTQENLDEHRLRKFGCAAESRVRCVECAGDLRGGFVQQRRGEFADRQWHGRPLQKITDLGGGFFDVGRPLRKGIGHRGQHASEPRHPEPIAGRKVGAGEKWRAVGQQEHGHRPSAGTGHALHRPHVDLVEIRPLFAIDLDGNEVAIHQRGGLRIFEGLAGHHVTPVAGAVADAQQDRLVFGAGALQCLRTPGIPVDRVVGVLEQVGAGLLGESVCHGITLAALLRMAAVMGQMDYRVETDHP